MRRFIFKKRDVPSWYPLRAMEFDPQWYQDWPMPVPVHFLFVQQMWRCTALFLVHWWYTHRDDEEPWNRVDIR